MQQAKIKCLKLVTPSSDGNRGTNERATKPGASYGHRRTDIAWLPAARPPTARGLVPATPRQNVATPSHEEGSICILGERELRMRLTRRTFCTEGSACGCREGRDIYSLRSPRDSFQNFHPYYRGTHCSALEGSTGCIRNCFPPHVIRFRATWDYLKMTACWHIEPTSQRYVLPPSSG
jgi:hypothetical protein